MRNGVRLLFVFARGSAAAAPPSLGGVPVGLIAGACSKLLRDVIIHPIDTVKNRRQIETARSVEGTAVKRSPIYANLYDGIGPSLISGVPAGALYLYIGDILRSEHLNSGLSGVVASFVFWTVRTPGEVVKTRMQIANEGSPAGLIETLERMRQEEGLGTLYSGYAQTLCRSLPFDFLRFALFDAIRSGELMPQLLAASPWADTLSGFAASGLAALITQPLDVAKTIEQSSRRVDGQAGSVQELISRTTASNVLQMWWAGSPERVVLAALSGGIYFGAYEAFKRALEAAAAGSTVG